MKYDVFGVGNALVDIQTQIGDAELEALGFPRGGMSLVDDDVQTSVLAKLNDSKVNRCAGGSAANTIVGIAEFGGKVAYAGKVASDPIGDFFLQDMRETGVAIEVPQAGTGQSGTCVVLITDDAERTMLTNLAVSGSLSADDIDENELKQCQYIYVEGYLFTGDSTRAAALRAIELAKKNNVKVAFTVSDPFLIGLFRDEFLALAKDSIDLLFCNEEEAKSLIGKDDTIECAHAIHDMCENVALTLGAHGSILMHGGEVISISGVKCDAIDTTGAGDMYAAGILYGITNGKTWQQAGELASHASSRIVSQMGARLDKKFSREEIASIFGMA